MSRWGTIDKKNIVYILESGISYMRDKLKDNNKDDISSLWNDYTNLHNLLYNEGRQLLSMTNAVKFEKNLKTIKKRIEKIGR